MKLLMVFLLGGFMAVQSVSAGKKDRQEHGKHKQKMEKMDMQRGEEKKEKETDNMGICPVMGGTASKDISYTYKDKTYYFCCPMCIGKFKKDPEKYVSKIKKIEIEAYQFGFSPERIVVNKGDIVRITAVSRDVTHGLMIKEYDINIAAKAIIQ